MRIAIIGAGISGLLAARLLDDDHDVHVIEADSHAGGHTNTVSFEAFGRRYAADTGFVVFNDRTYPNFAAMLRLLGLRGRRTDMSFSVRIDRSGLEYQGSSLNGLFAQRRNLFRRSFHRTLLDIRRFNRRARELLQHPGDGMTLGSLLERDRYSTEFIEQYLVPIGAACWSAGPDRLLQCQARLVVTVFDHHGLLRIGEHLQWNTVQGGAARYVKALTRPFALKIRLNWPARSIRRRDDGVMVDSGRAAPERFDCVVLATHADQSLALLADASEAEREILSSIPYQRSEAILHTDPSMLPRARRAWASWNCRVPAEQDRSIALTCNLNRLQGLRSRQPICLTLNEARGLDDTRILRRFVYDHPVSTSAARAARKRFDEINGQNRTYFCGAYWGDGLHEDGVNSALAVGQCFGARLESLGAAAARDTSGRGA
jgi:uncharacterized protein